MNTIGTGSQTVHVHLSSPYFHNITMQKTFPKGLHSASHLTGSISSYMYMYIYIAHRVIRVTILTILCLLHICQTLCSSKSSVKIYLQPMLQELGKQNPNLMRLIQDHQADFLGLINEPVEGGEGYGFFSSLCWLEAE